MKICSLSLLRPLTALSLLAVALSARANISFFPTNTTLTSGTVVGTNFGDDAILGYANFGDYLNEVNGTSPVVTMLAGAAVNFNLEARNASAFDMLGGDIGTVFGTLKALDVSTVSVSGGNVAFANTQFSSTFNLSGGTLGGITDNDASRFNMSGGTVAGSVLVDGDGSIARLSGGTVQSSLEVDHGSIVMVGRDLTKTLVDANFQGFYSLYNVSGHLTDGTTLVDREILVENGTNAALYVQTVPEPCSVLAIAGLLAGFARRRKPAGD